MCYQTLPQHCKFIQIGSDGCFIATQVHTSHIQGCMHLKENIQTSHAN